MAMIELSLSLDLTAEAVASEARAFIDYEPEQGFESEIEVPLWPDGPHRWRGHFSIDEARREQFSYRIGLCGRNDAAWSLRFRLCGSDAELLEDGDRLVGSKGWLLGSCATRPAAQREESRPSAIASGDRKRAARPELRLLRGGR